MEDAVYRYFTYTYNFRVCFCVPHAMSASAGLYHQHVGFVQLHQQGILQQDIFLCPVSVMYGFVLLHR